MTTELKKQREKLAKFRAFFIRNAFVGCHEIQEKEADMNQTEKNSLDLQDVDALIFNNQDDAPDHYAPRHMRDLEAYARSIYTETAIRIACDLVHHAEVSLELLRNYDPCIEKIPTDVILSLKVLHAGLDRIYTTIPPRKVTGLAERKELIQRRYNFRGLVENMLEIRKKVIEFQDNVSTPLVIQLLDTAIELIRAHWVNSDTLMNEN